VAKDRTKLAEFRENQAVFGITEPDREAFRRDGYAVPDGSKMTFGERFQFALRLLSPKKRESALGKADKTLRSYDSESDVSLDIIMALAKEAKLPAAWLIFGQDESSGEPSDDVPVRKLGFKAGAGSGSLILDEDADHVRFPRTILEHIGVAPQNARLLEATGDSMSPTINDGDMMLVDVSNSAAQIIEGRIFLFALGDEAYVKRLRRSGGRMMMVSDNREMFPEEAVPGEPPIQIYGRVMWAGRSL
jgi:phage repressor protein C with HTH and peptisase S24 domain